MLRIGVLCDGGRLRQFDAELLRRLEAGGIAKVALSIEQQLPARRFAARALRALRRGTALRSAAFDLAVRLERRKFARQRPEIEDLFRTVAIDRVCGAERLAVEPVTSEAGDAHRFARADVESIAARNLDLILAMGSGTPQGEILNAAAHGIISFQHGDRRARRGGPPGFREVLERRDCTGYVIERLAEEPDAGVVLARGDVATRSHYLLNQYHLFKSALTDMVDSLARIARGDTSASAARPIEWRPNVPPAIPAAADTLRYLGALLWRSLAGNARRALVSYDVWELRALAGDWRAFCAAQAKALTPPRGKFWADPFIVRRAGQSVIFFEEYEYARGKAHISALVSDGEAPFVYAGPVVATPYHLSFPFVFQYQGRYYMCPEIHQAGSIQLWRCTSWPLEWRYEKTILAGVAACDTMLFERDGRWWLLTSLDRDGTGDYCRELHAYHSDSPLSETWTPLPCNPVVVGASRARNAGLLARDGRLYRLAQSQGFDLYGKSLKLFEITALSERGYRERLIAELLPGGSLRAKGTHHLSACEGMLVFDALRPRLFWSERFLPRSTPKREPRSTTPSLRRLSGSS